jgi:hypothetical protein
VTGDISIAAPPLAAERKAVAYPLLSHWAFLYGVIAVLATLPYLPLFTQPFLSDDYIQLGLGRQYGPVSSWLDLLADPLYRCRATSILMTHWTEQWFGTAPLPFYTTSVLLHVLNTWLLLIAARRLGFGRVRSGIAAAFFAVYQAHQEAVMWYAALPELLLFFFCACFLLSWNSFLRRESNVQYVLAMLWFVLALLSKEAAVILVPVAAALAYQRERGLFRVAPFALAAVVYTAAIFGARDEHLHLNDGTFSLQAPFVAIWAKSLGRMLWFSGFLAILAIAAWHRWAWRAVMPAVIWMGVALLPFSFLLYMPVVPSRHTYLASAGIGFLVATGLLVTSARFRTHRWILPVSLLMLLTHNTTYVLVKKRSQFLERAAATEDLLRVASGTKGLIYMTCFPYGRDVAEKAIEIKLAQSPSRLVWDTAPPPGVITFCAKDP